MQIPILNGVYTDNSPDIRTLYPLNLIPVAQQSGISNGYLKPADGIISNGTGPGINRGGINWNDVCYRVMGSKLVSVAEDGTVTTLADVETDSQLVSMDYSFDRLAVASNSKLFYWDGTTLTEVTDSDLGTVVDMIWIDGYFMTTDGENLVVTELADPTQVSPTKYAGSELDPDPIVALLKLRNEAYALNRYTIEVFTNIGGSGFPFAPVEGAQIQKGCVGTHACCVYMESIAFLGGSRNEQPCVYLGSNGNTAKISTREIDLIIETYSEAELATVKMEARNDKDNQLLYIHLPNITLVYDAAASRLLGGPVWHRLSSTLDGSGPYRGKNLVYAYEKWLVGDIQTFGVGYLDDIKSEHWGEKVGWEFGTSIVYNEANGAIFSELELISLTGRIELGKSPVITTSYSLDGQAWSQDYRIEAGTLGDRQKRLAWRRQGFMRNFRVQRFQGDSDAHLSFARLEAQLEPMAR